ncbi:hypothetical protein [Ferrimonas kyonanensis]|nr:hypothetical protein [Ferrimonas kyonanensis]
MKKAARWRLFLWLEMMAIDGGNLAAALKKKPPGGGYKAGWY